MKARAVGLILDFPSDGLIDVSVGGDVSSPKSEVLLPFVVEGGVGEDDVFVFRVSDSGAGSLNALVDLPMGLLEFDDETREVDCCLPPSYLSLRGWASGSCAKAEPIEKMK
jgi:hypothetical protein